MKDISKLPTFIKKRILVVIAHPDDECLYFYGGLTTLAKISDVTVLSVTQSAMTTRGGELRAVCESLNIKCAFLNLPDRGLQSTLPDFMEDLENYLLDNNYDLVITHPPHGGEKPHPHHLQTLLTVFSSCLKLQVKFAFFSENHNSLCEPTRLNSLVKLKLTPLLSLYAVQTTWRLHWFDKFIWLQILFQHFFKLLFELKSQRKLFVRFEIHTSIEEKKAKLQMYATQKSVLDSYQTASLADEYLFLLTGLRISRNSSSIGTENLMKDYHEFKTSTAFQIGTY